MISILASLGGVEGSGRIIEPWEIHPMLVHFPIAFLLGAVALELYARVKGKSELLGTATALLHAGVLTGIATALAGVLAFYLVPAHTKEAHRLMYWHLGVQSISLLLFGWVSWARWKGKPAAGGVVLPAVAALLLIVGSGIGGYIVYHGGAGVEPQLLRSDLRSHSRSH